MPTTKPTVIEQLTSLSEEALDRLVQNPLAHRAVEAGLLVKTRVEKLVASLADLDGRVTRIEQRLDALEKKMKPATTARTRRPASKPRSTAEAPAAASETPPAAAESAEPSEPAA
jgi:hypothetical protein